jgi:hypothetical protein
MGGKQTSVWGQSVIDPLGAAIERKTFGKNKGKTVRTPNTPNQEEELLQMMRDRQTNIANQLQRMQTPQQYPLQNQKVAPVAPVAPISPVAPVAPLTPVEQNTTNAILNPAPTVTPTSSVAAPTAMLSNAPLVNQATGIGQQKINQFSMPSASGLKFGGT